MSTHNIGFYEDLTKIIFELSSNIIKYAPYFFCCSLHEPTNAMLIMRHGCKNDISDKKLQYMYFSYKCSMHRFWILLRTVSSRRF